MTTRKTGREIVWAVPAAIGGLAVALVTFIVVFHLGSDDEPSEPPGESDRATGTLSEVEGRAADDPMAMGPADAPVVLVVFSDYQCPFCARWSADTLPALIPYAESGRLRIEWRDVNVFGEESERAARASYAAALQDRFWEYHDGLFPEGEIRGERGLSEAGLIELAGELDLDTERFADDMIAPSTIEVIDEQARLGLDLGAHSTPTFVLGGEPIVGAQPTPVFVDALERALASVQD